MEAIVRHLTPEESSDGKHLREFLLTYNYYTTAQEVLEILFERFRKNLVPTVPGQPAIIPLRCTFKASSFLLLLLDLWVFFFVFFFFFFCFFFRVINFIRRWLKEFFYDLEEDDQSLSSIEQFLDVDVAKADASLARWVDQIKKIIKEQTAAKAFPAPSGGMKRAASLPAESFPGQGLLVYDEDDHHDGYTKTDFTSINPVGMDPFLGPLSPPCFQADTLFFSFFLRHLSPALPAGGISVQVYHAKGPVYENGQKAPREVSEPDAADHPVQQCNQPL